MTAQPVKGRPVSKDVVAELKELRDLFKPETSAKALDTFSTWLFATVAVVGTVGTALGATGVNELSGGGKKFYAWAVVALGASLALATISRIPQLSRYNPYSALSMRRQLHRILLIRSVALVLAGIGFAVALMLAAWAPLKSTESGKLPAVSMTYALPENGQLVASFAVGDAQPLTAIFSELRTRAPIPPASLPRARAMTNADGDASISLKLKKASSSRRVVLVGRWINRDGVPQTNRLVIWIGAKSRARRS
jgi:hypothetical protein